MRDNVLEESVPIQCGRRRVTIARSQTPATRGIHGNVYMFCIRRPLVILLFRCPIQFLARVNYRSAIPDFSTQKLLPHHRF